MSQDYDDGKISVSADGLTIRSYYFLVGTKRVAFERILAVTRVNTGAVTGRGRIGGTANPSLWANLDVKRPRKKLAFIINAGGPVHAYVTPDDPAAFEQALAGHIQVPVTHGGRSPFI